MFNSSQCPLRPSQHVTVREKASETSNILKLEAFVRMFPVLHNFSHVISIIS